MYNLIILLIPRIKADLIPTEIRVGPHIINLMYIILGIVIYRIYMRHNLLQSQKNDIDFDKEYKRFVVRATLTFVTMILIITLMTYHL